MFTLRMKIDNQDPFIWVHEELEWGSHYYEKRWKEKNNLIKGKLVLMYFIYIYFKRFKEWLQEN